MLKKSLIALAIAASAVTGAANAAATITVTPAVVNLEGHAVAALGNNQLNDTDLGGANDVAVAAGTAYIVNDLVYVVVSGATFLTTDTPAIAATTAGTGDINFVDFADANTARFRITTADWAAADSLSMTSFTLKTSGATKDTVVKFTANAVSVNPLIGVYDAAAAPVNAFTFQSNTTTAITKLNGEVSTGAGRAEFTSSANQDVLTIANTVNAGTDSITPNKATHVITGDFSWMMDYDLVANGGDADGVLDAGEIVVAVTDTGCTSAVATLNTALTTLTVTDSGAVAASCAVELNNVGNTAGGSTIAAPQDFTVTSTYTDGTNGYSDSSASAGAFSLDGSTGTAAFLPFGSEYAQSITVTNSGSVVGAITVDLTFDGTKYSKTLTAVAAAKTVTNISLEVATFAAESGVDGNARVNVTTNAPGITVESVYYHKSSADRVLVPTLNQ